MDVEVGELSITIGFLAAYAVGLMLPYFWALRIRNRLKKMTLQVQEPIHL